MEKHGKENLRNSFVPKPRNFAEPNLSPNLPDIKKNELEFRGISVSKGVAIGKVVRLHGRAQFYKARLAEEQIEAEIRRFRVASRLTRQRLNKIRQSATENFGEEQGFIFDSHILILEDKIFREQVESLIRNEKINAEWAIKTVGDKISAAYSTIEDDYLRERRADVEDVIQSLLLALTRRDAKPKNIEKGAILLTTEILPSAIAEFSRENVQAIVAERGGWTSHSFILARELGLPGVSGIKNIFEKARSGDLIIVDGFNGRVFLNPSAETVNRYRSAIARFKESQTVNLTSNFAKFKTLDGTDFIIRANLDLASGYSDFKQFGGHGIGLFRSEFLIGKNGRIPSENEQFEVYRKLARLGAESGTKIRLFDCGVEVLPVYRRPIENNPALGLRAIRLGLVRDEILRPQLRAILRVAATENIEITLPMISDVREIRQVRAVLAEETEKMMRRNIACGKPRVGIMIEVPAAALTADILAQEADFFSLGTNDLVQYLLAVDRDNEVVADWFRTLHPAVLLCIKQTLEAAKRAEITALVCGEMASSPIYTIILLGLGATEFSMTATAIPRVRHILNRIKQSEAREIAEKMLAVGSPDETEEIMRREFGRRFGTLFPPEMFTAPRLRN